MVDTLIGEVCVWLGALVFWLWPAYVRHRLLWGLWFWLHPQEVTARVVERPEPSRLKGIDQSLADLQNAFATHKFETWNSLQNAYNRSGARFLGQDQSWWDEPSVEIPGMTRRQAMEAKRSYNIATDQFEIEHEGRRMAVNGPGITAATGRW